MVCFNFVNTPKVVFFNDFCYLFWNLDPYQYTSLTLKLLLIQSGYSFINHLAERINCFFLLSL